MAEQHAAHGPTQHQGATPVRDAAREAEVAKAAAKDEPAPIPMIPAGGGGGSGNPVTSFIPDPAAVEAAAKAKAEKDAKAPQKPAA